MAMLKRIAFISIARVQLNSIENTLHTNSSQRLRLLHSSGGSSLSTATTSISNSNSNSNCSDSLSDSSPLDVHTNIKLREHSNPKLQSKIVFQDDDIVAINKPQGLSIYGNQQSAEYSVEKPLVEMLPSISQHLGVEELDIGLSLKSYYSGLVLLTKNPSSAEKLRKVLSGASSQRNLHLTYLAIVVGKPQCEMLLKKEMYLERQYLHDQEMSVVCDKSITSARKEGKMIQAAFSVNIISSNDSTVSSLVEIKISKDKWDAIPVLLSHFLSPVVGDNVYFSRTNYLMGVPFPAPPHMAFPGKQRLPINTENALRDRFNLESSPLPLFVHRHKVTLNNFPFHSPKPYVITAPPTAYFTTALDCLGLRLGNGE